MNLILIPPTHTYQLQITNFLDEWKSTGEPIAPSAIAKFDYQNFDKYCKCLECCSKISFLDRVPSSIFFCLDIDRDIVVGAVDIRHRLNDKILHYIGHIGDGVLPSERRKGIATAQIGLALEKCKELGIDRVLITCLKENVGSAKSIINNGGVLENEVEVDGRIFQRYWIENDK